MNKYVLNIYAVVSAFYCYYCSMMLQKPGRFPNECCIFLLSAFSLEIGLAGRGLLVAKPVSAFLRWPS